MNIMNKCAKFHKDSPSDKKVKFNLPSTVELSEHPFLCTTLYRNLMQASNFGGTFDQLKGGGVSCNNDREAIVTSERKWQPCRAKT